MESSDKIKMDDQELSVHQFSDSTVRIFPVNDDRNGIVLQELYNLVHIQYELIQKEILIRGGVTYGDIYDDGKVVFGPAFNRVYELESKYAINPRLIIDPKLIEEVKMNEKLISDVNGLKDELRFIKNVVTKDKDGFYFVDYLRAIRSELDDINVYPDVLKFHKNLINKKYNKQS